MLRLLIETAVEHSNKLDLVIATGHGVLWQVSDPAVDSVVARTRCLLMLGLAQLWTLTCAKAIARRRLPQLLLLVDVGAWTWNVELRGEIRLQLDSH